MKIVILGDTHFGSGYSLGTINPYRRLNSRLIDYSNTFDYVVDYIKSENIKHLVIAGDIFEYRRPQASELSLFSEKLYRLSEIGVYTHILVGNHDMIRDQSTTTIDVLRQLKLPMIHIYADINSVVCDDGDNHPINLIFFPFRTKQMLDCSSNESAVHRLSDMLQYEVRSISNGPKILIGHFILQETVLGKSISGGNTDEVVLPVSMFDGLDGVIMGHMHIHNIIQYNPLIAYIGSMERENFGDMGCSKYFLIVEAKDKLTYKFEKLPAREIYSIDLDCSSPLVKEDITKRCVRKLEEFSENNKTAGSIIRLNIMSSDQNIHSINRDEIMKFLRKRLRIHRCVGIYTQVTSSRQLRKSTITEHTNPTESFEEYLSLVTNSDMRELMRERGLKIIREYGK